MSDVSSERLKTFRQLTCTYVDLVVARKEENPPPVSIESMDSSSPSSSPKRFMNRLRSSSISEDMSDDRDNGYAVESRFGVSSVTVRVELLDMMDDCGVKEDVKLRDSRIMSRGV